MEYFIPYEGKNPYVFVSYAHRDSARVLKTAARLHDERFRVWYDEGIPAGTDWPRSVEEHLRGCSCVLFFKSEKALNSANCYSEVSTASFLKIPIYVISLDDSIPEDRWNSVLEKSECTDEQSIEEHLESRFKYLPKEKNGEAAGRGRFNAWTAVAVISVLLFSAALLGARAIANGRFPGLTEQEITEVIETQTPEPQPTVGPDEWEDIFRDKVYLQFPDAQQADAVKLMLNMSDDSIRVDKAKEIRELYFCGSFALDSADNISRKDGKYFVRTSVPAEGSIDDLSFIASMLNLEKLVLIYQPLDSVTKLSDLVCLRELNVSGCRMEDLKGISGFPALEILNIEHTQISDLTPLKSLPKLKTVTVSTDMLPLQLDSEAEYEVILVN